MEISDAAAPTGWVLTKWDGNKALNYMCYRKKFPGGHVSVGVGEFDLIVYSYGSNSERSMSSTRSRWMYGRPDLTEIEAMKMVDANGGQPGPHKFGSDLWTET